jgi:DNA-binding NtrC family response regulator
MLAGVSPAITALRAYLPKVARSRATVLITGDTGTGKERVARAIHELGTRSRKRFVAVNCAALPDSLIESELFGHVRGAFTGAISAMAGRFEQADGGTIFLDEIGEMTQHAQAKLLRALETQEVTPIGAERAVPVDVRVIAATNQALEDLVADNRFRIDLFYRLNVVRLALPPLRDRREDIPVLLNYEIALRNAQEESGVGEPNQELLECLMAYSWPGNVRELRNLVEAVFIDPPTGAIGLDHLPPSFRGMFAKFRTTGSSERDRMLGALRATHWNKSEAAKHLHWSRMTLYRKLEKYHLEQPE